MHCTIHNLGPKTFNEWDNVRSITIFIMCCNINCSYHTFIQTCAKLDATANKTGNFVELCANTEIISKLQYLAINMMNRTICNIL